MDRISEISTRTEPHVRRISLVQLPSSVPPEAITSNINISELGYPKMDIDIDVLEKVARPRFVDMAHGILNIINLCTVNNINTVFFLDKSGRPVAHFFNQLFKSLYPDRPVPNIRLMNVGRYEGKPNGPANGYENLSSLDISRLQAYFADLPHEQNILLIDEFVDEGRTITAANKILHQIFPESKILSTAAFHLAPPWRGNEEAIGVKEKDDDGDIVNSLFINFINTPESAEAKMKLYDNLDILCDNIVRNVAYTDPGEAPPVSFQLPPWLEYLNS